MLRWMCGNGRQIRLKMIKLQQQKVFGNTYSRKDDEK